MTDPRKVEREQRSRRAVAAAVACAGRHGVRCADPTVLADLFSVMVHLQPAPVVARVSTWTSEMRAPIAEWLEREIEVTAFLSGRGAPAVAPSPELPAVAHVEDGFAITFWTYLKADPDRTPTMSDCSAMLVDLHAELRSYPGELPVLAPAANDIAVGLGLLDDRAADLLAPAELAILRDAADRLAPFVAAPDGPLQPLHGDVHPGNLLATRGGLVWIDFEDVCRGPVEWDLAMMPWLDGGATELARHEPDPERLARCSQLRALQLALDLIAFRDAFGDTDQWDDHIRGFVAALSEPAPH